MSERFFVDEPIRGDKVTLVGPEAHHLLHVLRAKPGQEVILFDGSGREFTARIADCRRKEVGLHVVSSQVVSREAPVQVTLGVALPKGERQRWLVEKAAELGVAAVVPLWTDCSVSRPTRSALARLRRAVVEASKQCGRTRLMAIGEPADCRDFFAREDEGDGRRICAHPGEGRIAPLDPTVERVMLAVGPEGGFTEEEVRVAREHGWNVAGLGPRILRVETAAVALAAAFTLETAEVAGAG